MTADVGALVVVGTGALLGSVGLLGALLVGPYAGVFFADSTFRLASTSSPSAVVRALTLDRRKVAQDNSLPGDG